MIRSQWLGLQILCTVSLVFCPGFFSYGQVNLTETPSVLTGLNNSPQNKGYEPPDNGTAGGNEGSPASRGCYDLDKNFTAFIPSDHIGETVSDRPTFWLYVPYASTIEFVLMDQDFAIVYRESFEVSNAPGVIGFTPNLESPILKADQIYRWRFDFFCGSSRRYGFLQAVGSIIRRIGDNSVEDMTVQERIAYYAENGFWYEALTEVARGLQKNPTDEASLREWANLLQHPSVGLDDFVEDIPLGRDAESSSSQKTSHYRNRFSVKSNQITVEF